MDMDYMYEESRSSFEEYAGMDSPELPENPISALQVRLSRYQNKAYGATEDWKLVLGICEEVGETLFAANELDADGVTDGVCDIMIYTMQLMTSLRLDASVVFDMARHDFETSSERSMLAVEAGRIAHAFLKHSQGIRGLADKETFRRVVFENIYELISTCLYDASEEDLFYVADRVMSRVPSELPRSV